MISISFVGLPGSGKSTIGRLLARRLNLKYVDSDHVIEERIGGSIRAYFEQAGEERFRDLETQVIDELTKWPDSVIATGGGACLREANRIALEARTKVVYLYASPEELFHRLRHDLKRPLLQVADPLAKLHLLYNTRHPQYEAVSHLRIHTGRPSAQRIVDLVQKELTLDSERHNELHRERDMERNMTTTHQGTHNT